MTHWELAFLLLGVAAAITLCWLAVISETRMKAAAQEALALIPDFEPSTWDFSDNACIAADLKRAKLAIVPIKIFGRFGQPEILSSAKIRGWRICDLPSDAPTKQSDPHYELTVEVRDHANPVRRLRFKGVLVERWREIIQQMIEGTSFGETASAPEHTVQLLVLAPSDTRDEVTVFQDRPAKDERAGPMGASPPPIIGERDAGDGPYREANTKKFIRLLEAVFEIFPDISRATTNAAKTKLAQVCSEFIAENGNLNINRLEVANFLHDRYLGKYSPETIRKDWLRDVIERAEQAHARRRPGSVPPSR